MFDFRMSRQRLLLFFQKVFRRFSVQVGQQHQLHHVEPPVPRLCLRYPRVKHTQLLGYVSLRKARILTRFTQFCEKLIVSGLERNRPHLA
jgi:hypothetical protein